MKKKLHMIGNSHIDIGWFWRTKEGLAEIKNTFHSALQRMEEFPDFIFTASSVYYHKWIEQIDPDMFEQIKRRAQEGRWQIVGGWLVEADCNLPSGEALIRQALYGKKYLRETFGMTCNIGFNIDSFGHNANLPQILKVCGIDYYVFQRPGPGELPIEKNLFHWQGVDGTVVKACRIPGEYTAWSEETLKGNLESAFTAMETFDEMLCFFGVGNHGGGPTVENIKTVKTFKELYADVDIEFSSIKSFFDKADSRAFGSLKGGLSYISEGCYTTDSRLKKLNRYSENKLLQAEKLNSLSALAHPSNMPLALGNKSKLDEAWELLLVNGFHDTICGTSIESASNDAVAAYHSVINTCEFIIELAKQRIARFVNTLHPRGLPLFIFNTKSYDTASWVELEIPWDCKWDLTILDSKDQEVVYDRVMTDAVTVNKNFGGRRKVVFKAQVPAFGYAQYRLVKEKPSFEVSGNYEEALPVINVMQNKHLEVNIDEGIASILSRNGLKVHDIIFKIIEDDGGPWGNDTSFYNNCIAVFKPIGNRTIENSHNRSCVEINYEYCNPSSGMKSTLTQLIYLYKDEKYVIIKNYLNWQEKGKMLKMEIDTNLLSPDLLAEIPYAFEKRPDIGGHEEFNHSYIGLVQKDNKGVIVCTDSKYGYDFHGNKLNFTICRSPIFAQGNWFSEIHNTNFRYTDQGEQIFTILIEIEDNIAGTTCRKASDRIQTDLEILFDTNHTGINNAFSHAFINNSNEAVRVSVLKFAEASKAFVLRAVETNGTTNSTQIEFLDKKIKADFKPFEIKTFLVSEEKTEEVNAIENV